MRSVMLIEDAYDEIQAVELAAIQATTLTEFQDLLGRLSALEDEIRLWSISSEEMNRLYTMKGALNLVRLQVLDFKKRKEVQG